MPQRETDVEAGGTHPNRLASPCNQWRAKEDETLNTYVLVAPI
jgi:hypothetical protein